MNQLQRVFNYRGNGVRTVINDGEPWFAVKDICEYFGDKHYRRSVGRLDDDEKGVTPFDTPGGIQHMAVVNEPGLYNLLFIMQPQKKEHMTKEEYEARVVEKPIVMGDQAINKPQTFVTAKGVDFIAKLKREEVPYDDPREHFARPRPGVGD